MGQKIELRRLQFMKKIPLDRDASRVRLILEDFLATKVHNQIRPMVTAVKNKMLTQIMGISYKSAKQVKAEQKNAISAA